MVNMELLQVPEAFTIGHVTQTSSNVTYRHIAYTINKHNISRVCRCYCLIGKNIFFKGWWFKGRDKTTSLGSLGNFKEG